MNPTHDGIPPLAQGAAISDVARNMIRHSPSSMDAARHMASYQTDPRWAAQILADAEREFG